MSYWNRDQVGVPHRLYCDDCFHGCADGVPGRVVAWKAIRPECGSMTDYLRGCYGGRVHFAELVRDPVERVRVRDHAVRMTAMMTPDGWAWDRRYGLETRCDHCGVLA